MKAFETEYRLHQFAAAVKAELTGDYRLEDGRLVFGEAPSHLMKTLYLKGWKGLSPLGQFERACKEAGFKVERGHGLRIYHGGVRKYGAKALVIFGDEAPFNPALHEHLVLNGYRHERHPPSWEDIGIGESGPKMIGGPAYDEYEERNERVYVDATGKIYRDARNFEEEEREAEDGEELAHVS